MPAVRVPGSSCVVCNDVFNNDVIASCNVCGDYYHANPTNQGKNCAAISATEIRVLPCLARLSHYWFFAMLLARKMEVKTFP